MKNIVIAVVAVIAASTLGFAADAPKAAADERPVEWSLPGRGQNCRFVGNFAEQTIRRPTCGDMAYKLYNCTEWEEGLEREIGYLIIGEYQSDTANRCSATFVVKQVIRQNVPQIVRP